MTKKQRVRFRRLPIADGKSKTKYYEMYYPLKDWYDEFVKESCPITSDILL